MPTEPAHVVLVPGACCGPWIWRDVISPLDERGIGTTAVSLPSVSAVLPRGDLYDDAAATRAAIDAAPGPGPVVLVGHSSGGAVMTEAAVGNRRVEHLVYVAALVPVEGEAVLTMKGAPDPVASFEVMNQIYAFGIDGSVCFRPSAVDVPFGPDTDLPTRQWAAAELLPMSMVVYTQPITGTPWQTVPSTFVRCEHDAFANGVLHDVFDVCEGRAQRAVTFPTGHSPMLSRPDLVADLLTEIATT